jgi:hypothetical protein
MSRRRKLWLAWIAATLIGAAGLAWAMTGGATALFLIGRVSDGHHQFALDCTVCHTSIFGGARALDRACLSCHAARLAAEGDTHPASLFLDGRHAAMLGRLDIRHCVACHREHVPAITRPLDVTVPKDVCILCHRSVVETIPDHRGLAFTTCATSGCHDFHDNRALTAAFLRRHLDEDPTRPNPLVVQRSRLPPRGPPLAPADADAPAAKTSPAILAQWAASAHARGGVNCSSCHITKTTRVWIDRPGPQSCRSCHGDEVAGFLAGTHGIRTKLGLSPMSPAMARLPMKAASAHRVLDCQSCHAAHRYETSRADVTACLGCHDDSHSRAYRRSRHYDLWKAEADGDGPAGMGVSCATCHMPRVADGHGRIVTQHDPNADLRPDVKMARSVCLSCHGLGFTLDALSDPAVVAGDFTEGPERGVPTLDWMEKLIRRPENRSARPSPPLPGESDHPSRARSGWPASAGASTAIPPPAPSTGPLSR